MDVINKYLIPVAGGIIFSLSIIALLNGFQKTYGILSGLLLLYSAEHIYNFISRSQITLLVKLTNTWLQRVLAFMLPCILIAFGWLVVSAL